MDLNNTSEAASRAESAQAACSARFPLQAYELRSAKPKTIPWKFAAEAYEEYAARYGKQQSLERLAERGGFGAEEIIMLLCQRIERINSRQNDQTLPHP